MSKISELSDGGSLVSTDYLIAVRSGGNVKVRMDEINVDQVDLGDNEFIRLGNSQDLTLVHNASNSIINQAGIGDLLIQKAGSTKLTVNSTGIDVTGYARIGTGTTTPALLTLYPSVSAKGWQISANNYVPSALEFTCATANGGTTFTTPSMLLDASGNLLLNTTANAGGYKFRFNGVGAIGDTDSSLKLGRLDADTAYLQATSDAGVAKAIAFFGSSETMRIANTGQLLVGSGTSPASGEVKQTLARAGSSYLEFQNTSANTGSTIGTSGENFIVYTNSGALGSETYTERMRISGGNLLVGLSSGQDALIHAQAPKPTYTDYGTVFAGGTDSNNGEHAISLMTAGNGLAGIIGSNLSIDGSSFSQSATARSSAYISFTNTTTAGKTSTITFGGLTKGTATALPKMTLDGDGNLLVGKTATSFGTDGFQANADGQIWATNASGSVTAFNRRTTDGAISVFYKDGAPVGSIGIESSGFYIDGEASHSGLSFGGNSVVARDNGTRVDDTVDLGSDVYRFKDLFLSGAVIIDVDGATNNAWAHFKNDDRTWLAGCRGSDGDSFTIYDLTADEPRVKVDASGNLLVGTTTVPSQTTGVSTGVYFVVKGDIIPSVDAGFTGHSDLGDASTRYEDAYVRDGVTIGSDGNDKQDIEALSDAEQRVAVACKGLLRKWRWKDAVEEKGGEARIHFGIIAQDLQAAFEAEGLDAGRYAMFMSNTWTDEETGEERTRLGVRYHELLAFIIAAI